MRGVGEHREKGMAQGLRMLEPTCPGCRTLGPLTGPLAMEPTFLQGLPPPEATPLLLASAFGSAGASQRQTPTRSSWQKSLGKVVWTLPFPCH